MTPVFLILKNNALHDHQSRSLNTRVPLAGVYDAMGRHEYDGLQPLVYTYLEQMDFSINPTIVICYKKIMTIIIGSFSVLCSQLLS